MIPELNRRAFIKALACSVVVAGATLPLGLTREGLKRHGTVTGRWVYRRVPKPHWHKVKAELSAEYYKVLLDSFGSPVKQELTSIISIRPR